MNPFVRLARLATLLAALALPTAAFAVKPAALTAADRSDLARAEAYLNSITTLKARFLQVSPNGSYVEGDAYLARPGRMRLQYDPPTPVLVVADGRFLIYYDSQLKQVSYLGLDATPAGILVRPQVAFVGDDVTVTRVQRQPGVLNISLIQTKDPGAGEMTLVFSEQPFTLRQWRVSDAQGQVTTVSLFEAQSGVALDSKLFTFKDPNFKAGQPE